jgi:WD40 repeat protein
MGGGNDIRVLDTSTWTLALALTGRHLRRFAFDPTRPRLVTGSSKGDVSIWSIPNGARIWHLREVGEPVNAVAYSPDGELVVAASDDGAEQVWRAETGTLQSQDNHLHGKILSVEFDRTSRLVVAASASGKVAVSDAKQGMPITVLDGPRTLRVAHFDPSSRRVVGVSSDGTARIWDATAPYRRGGSPPVADDCDLVTGLEPDQRFVAVGCRDYPTYVWDTARDQLLAELPSVSHVEGDWTSAFPAVSAEGDRAAIARGTTVEIYEVPGGRLLRKIAHGAAVNSVAFASVGHEVVSGAVDGSLLVTRDGRDPIVLPGFPGGIDAAGLLADGRVVAADARRRVRIYDPALRTVLADLEIPSRVMSLRISPDDQQLITIPSYLDRMTSPVLLDLHRYRVAAQLDGHVGRVFSVRWVAGSQILTAGNDSTTRLWDSTGRIRRTFYGGSRFIVDATLTSDGSMVVAGDADGLLRFWDASTGRPLWTMLAHRSPVVGIRVESDTIVTRGFSGDISRWVLPRPVQAIEACGEHQTCAIVPQ